jgi:hypothetical protein
MVWTLEDESQWGLLGVNFVISSQSGDDDPYKKKI